MFVGGEGDRAHAGAATANRDDGFHVRFISLLVY